APRDRYAQPCVEPPLSERWQRVAIKQAAGIAQSWRSNFAAAYQDYVDRLAAYQEVGEGDPPPWQDWHPPTLSQPVLQANANVAPLQPAEESSFYYCLPLAPLRHR